MASGKAPLRATPRHRGPGAALRRVVPMPVPRLPYHQRRVSSPAAQRGVMFLMLLVVIAVMGITLGAIGSFWRDVQRRDKERELLFIGMQYRNAIMMYYNESPGGGRYPPTLDDLLRDERVPGMKRYLRRPYLDPLTRLPGWGVVEAPGGGVMGVYSLAAGRPIKQANFPAALRWKEGASSYADWRFIYLPPTGQLGF